MKKILTSLVILMSLLVLAGCDKKEVPNNVEDNFVAPEVVKEQTVEGLKFLNTSIVYENEQSTFTTVVTNTLDVEQNVKGINIIIKDKNGFEIVTLVEDVNSVIAPKQSITIKSSYLENITNAGSIEYEIIK